jgi:large subunit ribosomal protein L30
MEKKKIAVVRVRGGVDIDHRLNDTLRLICLTRVNHCSIIDISLIGMVHKCKDLVTWGEIDEETCVALIAKRGMKVGNKRLSEEDFKNTPFKTLEGFAAKFMAGEAKLADVGVKKVFRLHPPRKGHGHIKILFPRGALGNRKGEINALLKRMM